jgi:hypothetical protein
LRTPGLGRHTPEGVNAKVHIWHTAERRPGRGLTTLGLAEAVLISVG